MNILFEIADRDLLLIILALLGVVLLITIIFFAVVKNKIEEEVEEEPKEKELTEEQKKAKEELERVFNQMKADLEKQEEIKEEDIETFEREQEENAIISYKELIKQNSQKEKPKMTEKVIKNEEEDKKFKNSDIISPVFGIQNTEEYVTVRQEEKPTVQKTYDKMKKNTEEENNKEFLNSLREFRSNL